MGRTHGGITLRGSRITLLKFSIPFMVSFLCFHFLLSTRATTHSDLIVRAKTLGVETEVVHNASIMNAVGACGLQLYRYGEAISIPFFTETWRPDSFYDKIKANRAIGLHTLCLLGMLLISCLLQLKTKISASVTHHFIGCNMVAVGFVICML